MDLIAEIVAHLRYRLTIDCDIIFVTDRKHCSSGLTETWIRSSCFNIWPDPEVRIIGTEERIDMMYNAMDYDVILYLDDKPRAINNFAAYMPNNVMMLIPKFPYNDSEIQYCSDLKRDFHAMEHFLSCRYTKQSIDATLLAIEKFIKRIRYEARRSEDKGKTI
jgi:hypothetical protein